MNLKDSWGLKLIRFTDKMVTVSRVLINLDRLSKLKQSRNGLGVEYRRNIYIPLRHHSKNMQRTLKDKVLELIEN